MKRQRSRGRNNKPGNQNPNRNYESNGPDMKVRGSAQTIMERYQQAGRDAMGAGDRVLAENYFQHAEHYLRLLKAISPNFVPRSEFAIAGLPSDFEDDGEEGSENDIETEGEEEETANESQQMRDNNGRRDNRFNMRRRNRFRPDNRGYDNGQNENQSEDGNDTQSPSAPATENEGEEISGNQNNNQRRPRNFRNNRRPQQQSESQGFGDELPAFLAPQEINAE